MTRDETGAGRRPGRALGLAVLAALAMSPFYLGEYARHFAVSGGLVALSAMALTILTGSAGLPSLGTAAFLAIGGFASGVLALLLGTGIGVAIIVSGAMGLLVGVLIAVLTLRVSGLYLAVGTLALQHVIQIVTTDLDLKLTYASGFSLDPPVLFGVAIDTLGKWWLIVLILLIGEYGLLRYLSRTHVGRAWSLVRAQPAAAPALGVFVARQRVEVFALTSALIAIVGVITGYRLGSVGSGTYTVQLAVTYLAITAMGGAGNLAGAIVASYAIILLPTVITTGMTSLGFDVTSRSAGLESVATGTILILALIRWPQRMKQLLHRSSAARQ